MRCEIQIVAICQPLKETTFRNVEIKEIVSVETSTRFTIRQETKLRKNLQIDANLSLFSLSILRSRKFILLLTEQGRSGLRNVEIRWGR